MITDRRGLVAVPAPLLMLVAAALFALMGLCVKLASAQFSAPHIVMVRGLVGMVVMLTLARATGVSLATQRPGMHAVRCVTGVISLMLWYFAITGLPLATAMTLNYTSAVWLACFLVGGALLAGAQRVDGRLFGAVLLGFLGVALVLQPTFERAQLPWGLAGLASGVIAAMAYLQVTALGRAGEPELRVVFWFSAASALVGYLLGLAAPAPLVPPTAGAYAWVLAAGLLGSLAQVFMTAAYSHGRALVVASLSYSAIVFATLLGWTVLGERPGGLAIVGMALIVAAGLSATLFVAPSDSARRQKPKGHKCIRS